MATLQVKRLPAEVHAILKRRAEQQGVSLSDLVIRILSAEASLPSLAQWRADVAARTPIGQIDVEDLMDAVRDDTA